MSPLFGGRKAGDQLPPLPRLPVGELLELPAAEMAALLLPVWAAGDDTPMKLRDGERACQVIEAMLTGGQEPVIYRSAKPFDTPLTKAIAEAIAELEHARLLLRTFSSESGTLLHLTRRGARALAEENAASYLGTP
jgi:hypothetical protein